MFDQAGNTNYNAAATVTENVVASADGFRARGTDRGHGDRRRRAGDGELDHPRVRRRHGNHGLRRDGAGRRRSAGHDERRAS